MSFILTVFLWLILAAVCWPIAIFALVLFPIIWLLLLPFRLAFFALEGVLAFVRAIFFLPARILGGR